MTGDHGRSEDPQLRVAYVRIVADDTGASQFADASAGLALADFAPPAPPLGVSSTVPAAVVGFIGAPPGWDSPPHPTPRRQWVVMVQGAVDATTSDGEVRRFGPGEAVLLEDTQGEGHRTRVVSVEPWLALVVALDETALDVHG